MAKDDQEISTIGKKDIAVPREVTVVKQTDGSRTWTNGPILSRAQAKEQRERQETLRDARITREADAILDQVISTMTEQYTFGGEYSLGEPLSDQEKTAVKLLIEAQMKEREGHAIVGFDRDSRLADLRSGVQDAREAVKRTLSETRPDDSLHVRQLDTVIDQVVTDVVRSPNTTWARPSDEEKNPGISR